MVSVLCFKTGTWHEDWSVLVYRCTIQLPWRTLYLTATESNFIPATISESSQNQIFYFYVKTSALWSHITTIFSPSTLCSVKNSTGSDRALILNSFFLWKNIILSSGMIFHRDLGRPSQQPGLKTVSLTFCFFIPPGLLLSASRTSRVIPEPSIQARMVLFRISRFLSIWLFICSAAFVKPANNKSSTVKCLVDSSNCSEYMATLSEVCVYKRPAVQQPDDCKCLACEFCIWDSRRDHIFCKQSFVQSISKTFMIKIRSQDPSLPQFWNQSLHRYQLVTIIVKTQPNVTQPGLKSRRPGQWIMYLGDARESSVVVDIGRKVEKARLTKITGDGLDGLVYRKNKKRRINYPDRFGSLKWRPRRLEVIIFPRFLPPLNTRIIIMHGLNVQ